MFAEKQLNYEKFHENQMNRELFQRNTNDDDDADDDVFGKNKKCKISIDILFDLYKQNILTYDDCEAEAKHLMAAAFETTYFSYFCILMMLAMYPDWQEKVFQEIYNIFPDDQNKYQITFQDVDKLPYLGIVVSEVLRLLAPIPFIARNVEEDLVIQDGIVIPKGTTIAIDIFNMHRNPKYWGPNSENFNPENFLPDNIRNLHPYAYIPFARGSRTCIGEKYAGYSLKIMVAKMIRNFQFSTDAKFKDLRFNMDVTLKFQDNIPQINVIRRNK